MLNRETEGCRTRAEKRNLQQKTVPFQIKVHFAQIAPQVFLPADSYLLVPGPLSRGKPVENELLHQRAEHPFSGGDREVLEN